MNKNNISRAKDNICEIFNEIRSRHKYIFYMNYNYEDIQTMKEKELNRYGNFFDFIHWLISEKENFLKKMRKLKFLVNKMEEPYKKRLLPLLKEDDDLLEEKETIRISKTFGTNEYINLLSDNENLESMNGNDLSPIIYHNIIFTLRNILLERYKLIKSYNFNISKIFRKKEKENLKQNISICFPPFNQEEFIKKINEKIKKIHQKEEKEIEGKSSNICLFTENVLEPKSIKIEEKLINEYFIKEYKLTKGKSLDLNLDIFTIKDLSNANSLENILSVLNNGLCISQALMLCIGKLEKKNK